MRDGGHGDIAGNFVGGGGLYGGMRALFFIGLSFGMVLVGGFVSPAFGQGRFDRLDANRDGKLARGELPEPLQMYFDRLDLNRDGLISREEEAKAPRREEQNPGRPGMNRVPEGVKKLADLDYAGTGNPRQKLDLYLPEKRADAGPLPVIVFIHGGAWRAGDKSGGGGKVGPLVATGKFAGVSVGYRLSNEAQWPAQIHDCKAAIRWIKAHAKEHGLDPDRIAVWGTSAGGHLVAMLGVTGGDVAMEGKIGPHLDQSSRVQTVVDFFGPTRLLAMEITPGKNGHNSPDSPESKLIGGPVQENPEKAKNASPIEHVDKTDVPHLIVHGDADPVVPFAQSVEYEKRLEAAGVPVVLVTVSGGGHGQGFGRSVEVVVMAWLEKQLLGEAREVLDRVVKKGE